MSPVLLFLFFLVTLFSASVALQDDQSLPESWCITYLSTYLVPRSDGHTRPTASSGDEAVFPGTPGASLTFSTDLAVPSTFPAQDDLVITTSAPSPTTGTSVPDASGRSVIFRVVPESNDTKRDLQVRALGGFVGSRSEICAAATIFNLVQGRLLDGTFPIYYSGEDFKELRGYPGALPRDAVTETFTNEDGFLRFSSSVLPNGEAGFCQDAASGQVYMTFAASPPSCQSIRLSITEVDECRDGVTSSSPSSRPASMPMLPESTSALPRTTSPLNSIASPTTEDIQRGSSAMDVPTFTSQVKPVYTSSVRFYNSSSSIEYPTRPAIPQTSAMLDISTPSMLGISTPSMLDISTSVTDIPVTSQLSSWTSNAENLLTDALSTDVFGTSEELPSMFDPTTTATSTTMNTQNTIGTSSETASTASSIVHSSTTSGPSYSFETDTSTLSDLPLDASSSFDSSPTFTTATDTTTSITTSSEATGTRACPEGLSEPLTLFDGQRPSDNGVEWLVLPFLTTLFGETSDMIYISPNGLVTLRGSFGADSVPGLAFLPDENVESLAIFPYWIDMIVPEGSGAEVTYQIEDIPNQPGVLTIDWCVFSTSGGTEPNHFQMVLSEDQLTPITFLYYTIQPGGTIATIGAQNRDSDQFLQYYGPIPDRTFIEVSTFGDGEDLRIGQF